MLVSVLAATVGRGTPADKRMVMYVWRKLYQVMFFPEWITTFLNESEEICGGYLGG